MIAGNRARVITNLSLSNLNILLMSMSGWFDLSDIVFSTEKAGSKPSAFFIMNRMNEVQLYMLFNPLGTPLNQWGIC